MKEGAMQIFPKPALWMRKRVGNSFLNTCIQYNTNYIGISFPACTFYCTAYINFPYTILTNVLNKVMEVIN